MKKFVRPNRMLAGGIAAVLIVLVTGVVVSSIFAIGQARARAEAQLITNFLENDVLGSANRARVCEATVTCILDAASERLDEGKFKDKPLIEASIRKKPGCHGGKTLSRSCGEIVKRTGLKDILNMQYQLGLDMVSRSQQDTIYRYQRNCTTRLLPQTML